MSSPIQLDKTYGVLHTENYFSFIGFAKKIGSDEVQKIDIYLDDKLIDTILADEFIENIDDKYDVENRAFSYSLPIEYIGQKATISFKNHNSQEELLNSPYILIDKNHEDFNEARFIHSLSEPLSEELKNMYKPNSIGFLATKENLEDEEFVEYINQIMNDFPEYDFKALYFDKNSIKEIKEKFKAENLEYLQIKEIKDIFENLEVYLSNHQRDYKYVTENSLINLLRYNSNNLAMLNLHIHITSGLTLKPYEERYKSFFSYFFDNLQVFGFTSDEQKKYNTFHELLFKKYAEENGIEINFDINEKLSKATIYYTLILGFKNHSFFQFYIQTMKKLFLQGKK